MKIWLILMGLIALAAAIMLSGHLLAWLAALVIGGAAVGFAEFLNRQDSPPGSRTF